MLAGLIKTLLYILFFWYGFKLLAKIFAPFLMRYAANKVQEKFKDQMKQQNGGFGFNNQRQQSKKEGEVSVKSKISTKNKPNSESVGDYVDFEEIED